MGKKQSRQETSITSSKVKMPSHMVESDPSGEDKLKVLASPSNGNEEEGDELESLQISFGTLFR